MIQKTLFPRRPPAKILGPETDKEDWREQFECPVGPRLCPLHGVFHTLQVCMEEMCPPVRIHQCAEGHLLCEDCRWTLVVIVLEWTL